MIRKTYEDGRWYYEEATEDTLLKDSDFCVIPMPYSDQDAQVALHTNIGSITVLERMTGCGWFDVETGFRDPNGKFWLASGMCDVRESGVKNNR